MTTRQHQHELVKLRILAFLREPARQEFGTLGNDIRRGITKERMVDEERVLGVLIEDGLIERRGDAENAKARPYFITPKGVRYLEEQVQKAILPEFAPKTNWSDQLYKPRLEDTVSDFVRNLPEF